MIRPFTCYPPLPRCPPQVGPKMPPVELNDDGSLKYDSVMKVGPWLASKQGWTAWSRDATNRVLLKLAMHMHTVSATAWSASQQRSRPGWNSC